ncbi:MAG: RES family NAD+ phosphorylase [Panacagrimonas sp.]
MALLDTAVHFEADLYRNVVSIRVSQTLSDDLGAETADWDVFTRAEMATKPRRPVPAVNRPFEDGYGQAILYPFVKPAWFETRFSNGAYPAWYGSLDLETCVHETVHHFRRRLIEDSGLQNHQRPIVGERRVYLVGADALLIDLRVKLEEAPGLIDTESYAFCQKQGREVHGQGHPGLLTRSARCDGDNAVLFDPRYLSNPRDHCYLTYRYLPESGAVEVERRPGVVWMTLG